MKSERLESREQEIMATEQDYDTISAALAVARRRWPDSDRIEELEAWLRELAQDRLVLMEMMDAART